MLEFNFAHKSENTNVSPEYRKPYGSALPPVQSEDNLTYLQFIDLIDRLWTSGHPDINFQPFSANVIYNPERGYVIYSLVHRETGNNQLKPRYRESVDHPDNPKKTLVIFTNSFVNIVKFTAVHKDARIAEEIVEEFEDFIFESTPILKRLGLEEISYSRRSSDEHLTRYGDDLAARSVIFNVKTQKVYTIDQDKVENIVAQVSIALTDSDLGDLIEQATPNLFFTDVFIRDNHATPSP